MINYSLHATKPRNDHMSEPETKFTESTKSETSIENLIVIARYNFTIEQINSKEGKLNQFKILKTTHEFKERTEQRFEDNRTNLSTITTEEGDEALLLIKN